jgi:hypothetical protein
MTDRFSLYDVYEQNLNFLFGAGASYGFLPTLALKIKNGQGQPYTFETLAKELEHSEKKVLHSLLFKLYYQECIYPGLPGYINQELLPQKEAVIDNYVKFLKTLIAVLEKQSRSDKKCNIYTTNYDNCFELAADKIVSEQSVNCVVNDGSAGFQKRKFHTKNFNNRVIQKGIFDKHAEIVPQVNILHPHGSVYWERVDQTIEVNYGNSSYQIEFNVNERENIQRLKEFVSDPRANFRDIIEFSEDDLELQKPQEIDNFWHKYNQMPIVNPTKWKFHETVFEEAYYQILRHLSFELERPNSVLITFGFSFADEHILHLVQRSLSNPSLTVYISCYNESEMHEMKRKFKGYRNVKYIYIDDDLTFERFNKQVFTLKKDV